MQIALKKKFWSEVRADIRKVNPELAGLIDEVRPDDQCVFYEAEYDYADLMLNKGSWFLPLEGGGTIALTDPSVPKKIVKELNYNMYTNPTLIVLNKTVECFLELQTNTQPYSVYTLKPGQLIGLSQIVNGLPTEADIQPQTSIWSMSAGIRNAFFVHKISDAGGNTRLHRLFELPMNKPKTLDDHWHFFKNIYRQSIGEWKCKVLMFSRSWFTYLQDKEWRGLKIYFYQRLQDLTSFWSQSLAWNVGFSQIHFLKNINTSSLASAVTKHLMAVGTGKLLGFSPAVDNSQLPANIITGIYKDIYGASEYIPILMHPENLNYQSHHPIYVSLQRLNIEENYLYQGLPSTLKLLDEVQYTLKKYIDAIKKQGSLIDAPYLKSIAENVSFEFFHSVETENRSIQDSAKLKKDERFNIFKTQKNQKFPRAGKFFRGCIRLTPTQPASKLKSPSNKLNTAKN
jgi:hypothetical protein